MSKRHNRKRTRSRPRHRNNNPAQGHVRSESVDTSASHSTIASHYPVTMGQDHWHQTYMAWQTRRLLEEERDREVEMQRLRIFGGVPGEDEVSLLEPMLRVVTDLFDGFTDYEDP